MNYEAIQNLPIVVRLWPQILVLLRLRLKSSSAFCVTHFYSGEFGMLKLTENSCGHVAFIHDFDHSSFSSKTYVKPMDPLRMDLAFKHVIGIANHLREVNLAFTPVWLMQ